MQEGIRFAAIDVGSNAMRLFFCRVLENGDGPTFIKESMIRMPLRLGHDAFTENIISDETCNKFVSTMHGFGSLIQAYDPISFKACATEAMRQATNGLDLVKRVKEETGINLNIITGKEEADIIISTHIDRYVQTDQHCLYVDVGGGSTELTVINDGNIITSKSFKIGTVRMLNSVINKNIWVEYENWIKANIKDCNNISTIASGGNANKILKLSGKKIAEPISISLFEDIYKELRKHSFEERVSILNLNPDRADVIIPAAEIYLRSMKYSNSKQVIIPRIGLADGIIRKIDSNKYYGDILSK